MLGCTETEKQSEKNVSNLPIAPPVVIVYPVPVVEETEAPVTDDSDDPFADSNI